MRLVIIKYHAKFSCTINFLFSMLLFSTDKLEKLLDTHFIRDLKNEIELFDDSVPYVFIIRYPYVSVRKAY